MAPETLNRTGHGKAADWWSFGAIIYEMLVSIPPFYTKNRQQLYHNIKHEDLKLEDWLSDNAKDLLTRLLDKDPATRLGSSDADADEIKEHPWFASINWDDIFTKK